MHDAPPTARGKVGKVGKHFIPVLLTFSDHGPNHDMAWLHHRIAPRLHGCIAAWLHGLHGLHKLHASASTATPASTARGPYE